MPDRAETFASAPEVVDTMTAAMAAHARRLVADAQHADGVAPLSEQAVHAIAGGAGVRHVISAAGYANVLPGRDGEPAMIEAVIDPRKRRSGHGRALLDAAFEAARGESARAGSSSPRAWAHGDLPGAQALAAAMGLTRRRELLQLRRTGGRVGLDPVSVPDDIALRTYAGPDDDAEILRVNNAAFDWHPEQGGWSHAQIDERTAADWFDPAGLFLAFESAAGTTGPLLGFHWTKTQGPGLGEVYIVAVDPAAQGRGLGRLLTLAGLHYFADRGVDEVLLYVEGDNTSALHTYRRLGFEQYAIDVAYG